MTSTIQRYQPANGGHRPAVISQATAIEQSRAIAEVQAAVTVAQNCPRDMADAEREMEYVCGRLDMAEQAFYQVTNRGTGPSVHLMRELARIWGNVDYGVKELARNDDKGESEVQAFSWDMQKNTRSSRTFIVPHARMKKGNRVELTDLGDIYLNNQNVGARAVRECIATILPRWFTEKAQTVCRRTLEHGEGEPLQDRINTMVAWFRDKIGVNEKRLEARIGKKRGAWSAEDVAQMKIAGASITRGEVGIDELFPDVEAETAEDLAGAGDNRTPKRKSKLSGKVKDAGGEPDPGPDGGNGASEGDEPSGDPQTSTHSRDQDTPEEPPTEAPGGPTDATPGQTDRVAAALDRAKKNTMADSTRRKWLNRMFQLLSDGDCTERDDQVLVITAAAAAAGSPFEQPLEHRDALSDDQLRGVVGQLNAWEKTGDLAAEITEILNRATIAEMEAEQADGEGEQQ